MKKIFQSCFKPVFVIIFGLTFILILSCNENPEDNSTDKTKYTDTVSVETYSVETKELIISKAFSGTLKGEEQANIIAKIAERIMNINPRVGDYVKAGDMLIELDKSGAQSQFYQAQAAYLNAQKNLARMQNLIKVGAVSQQAFDAAETQYEVAKANFDAARSMVEITSPLSGIVTAINVNIGDLANPQLPMATVAKIGRMKVVFNVGEVDIPSFYVGQSAQIYSEMNPEVIQTGKIVQLSESANIQSRTFEIQAVFTNTRDKWFKPGMFCRVAVNMKTRKDALVIPLASIIKESKIDGVYVINDGSALFTPVTMGINDGNFVEILSGLKAADEIVTLGMNNLKDGTVVIVSNK
ncbi:MAG: efflux RND transporter periplasmic adaptor subunit [Ignavibacteria bacterium]|nr:efflux RND transporter periplasmic adaptor subunit [Ignavibacteria bacterium]